MKWLLSIVNLHREVGGEWARSTRVLNLRSLVEGSFYLLSIEILSLLSILISSKLFYECNLSSFFYEHLRTQRRVIHLLAVLLISANELSLAFEIGLEECFMGIRLSCFSVRLLLCTPLDHLHIVSLSPPIFAAFAFFYYKVTKLNVL